MIFILSYLELYGFSLDDFIECNPEMIKVEDGYVFELTQKKASICPYCSSSKIYIHDYKPRTIKIKHQDNCLIYFLIRMTRCKCKECGSSFTNALKGINPYAKFSSFTVEKVINSAKKMVTFKMIADENLMSKSRVMQIFDEAYPYVDSLKLPRVMCLDEIKFFTDIETRYVTVISNFETGEIIDVLPSRKIEVLKEYFASRYNEIKNVQYLVSDMYEGFNRIHLMFFQKAIRVIDLFHVIEDLTRAINRIRVKVMDTLPDSGEKSFMKNQWRLFLKRRSKVKHETWDKLYCYEKTNVERTYFDWLNHCLGKSDLLYKAYYSLQEMYTYTRYSTYKEGEDHLRRIISLLKATSNEDLVRVANTYEKNIVGIVNCLDKKSRNFRYTTGIAECLNNHIKTIIKMSYGCLNFQRFRKRVLLISRFNKFKRNIQKPQ